jgi:hypothetical protein
VDPRYEGIDERNVTAVLGRNDQQKVRSVPAVDGDDGVLRRPIGVVDVDCGDAFVAGGLDEAVVGLPVTPVEPPLESVSRFP